MALGLNVPARNVSGSPVHVTVAPRNLTLAPPFVRCDSGDSPRLSLLPNATLVCRVYGLGGPSGGHVTALSRHNRGHVTAPAAEDELALTYTFQVTAWGNSSNTTDAVDVAVGGVPVNGAPVPIQVTGQPDANASLVQCAAHTEVVPGFITRGSRVTCTVHAATRTGPVRALFSEFDVRVTPAAAGHDLREKAVVPGSDGRAMVVHIDSSRDQAAFALTVDVTLARGPWAGQPVRGSGVQYQLTDLDAPVWVAAPTVRDAAKGWLSLRLELDEPALV